VYFFQYMLYLKLLWQIVKKIQRLKCYLAKPKLLSRPTLVRFICCSRVGTMPHQYRIKLGRAEEVLLVIGRGFGQGFFLERDGFSFRSWRGPVGCPRAKYTHHRAGVGRRWSRWSSPVGDCVL